MEADDERTVKWSTFNAVNTKDSSVMETILNMLDHSAEKYAHNPYILEKRNDSYEPVTYLETREQTHLVAAGLLAMGAEKGDRIALLSEPRADWVISELGILHSGAVCVPLSILLKEGADLEFRLNHSESRWLIASARQGEKVQAIRQSLNHLQKIIFLDKAGDMSPEDIGIDELKVMGKEYLQDHPEEFAERVSSVGPGDLANICYTSGTTADPKGIMLTHRNYMANIQQTLSLMDVPEWWTTLLILPWDHSFAHTVGIYIMMATGASFAAVKTGRSNLESLKNIPSNIREIRPVFMLSAPALAKNFRKNIEKSVRARGKLVEWLFRHALKVAYFYNGIGWDKGKGPRKLLKPYLALYDALLFRAIRRGFGGRLKFFFGGAALLDMELQQFFYAIGIPMYQGYGLSEASPVISGNVQERHKLGSSGCPVRDLELKICGENGEELLAGEHGEIVVRGENVMQGYWKNEKATREAIRDGWLYTGDLGYVDEDGFLYVLGRFKSLLIGDDGEKYSPEGIEETISDTSPMIDQLMLYNNQDKYTSALLVPNTDAILFWAEKHKIDLHEREGLEAVLKELEKEIDHYRQAGAHGYMFPSRWLPSAVAVLDEPFSMDNGFLNSTGKMVRGKIVNFYRDRIEYMYTPTGKKIVNPWNIESLKKFIR